MLSKRSNTSNIHHSQYSHYWYKRLRQWPSYHFSFSSTCTVKPVYKGHLGEPAKVAILDRWPLYRGLKIMATSFILYNSTCICFLQIHVYCKTCFVCFPFIVFILLTIWWRFYQYFNINISETWYGYLSEILTL